MKDQLQSVLAESMRLKSSLEATNVDRDTLQNQLQEVHKAYDDLHKRKSVNFNLFHSVCFQLFTYHFFAQTWTRRKYHRSVI